MISIGRIVHYRLNEYDVERLWESSGNGRYYSKGDIVPMIVVTVWEKEYGDAPGVNGQCFLDNDNPSTLWVTSVREGTEPGTWQWPCSVSQNI